MKSRRRLKKSTDGSQKWLGTYADMITLVLVFFILLFSISQIDAEKLESFANSYRDRDIFNFEPSIVPGDQPSELGDEVDNPDSDPGPPVSDIGKEEQEIGNDEVDDNEDSGNDLEEDKDTLDELLAEVNRFLEKEGLIDVVSANRTERGVVLILQEKLLFESGQAEIIDEGKPFLDKVGKLLHTISNDVKVEGHTDSRPISTYRYPSNWELSGARASSVIRYLIDNHTLEDSRFQFTGFADTRPVAENNSPENWQKNRRVEIVILEDSEE